MKQFLPGTIVAIALLLSAHVAAKADTSPATPACGTVDLSSTSVADASKDFDCFAAAFQRCDSVSLVATGHEADVAIRWAFSTVKAGGGCGISETVQRAGGGTTTTDAYLCSSLSNEKDGLHFNGCQAKADVAVKGGDPFSQILQPLAQQSSPRKS
ncbi:MAG TPA: hypothetical protein VGQ96_04290 [Candidatus Eremiobacteraceae bacterium]|nr:hypothetical protein [Candidatus Eremiobacteraceae bacterium]